MVAGINVTPGTTQQTPVQQGINVTGTLARSSSQIVGRNGEERTIHAPDFRVAPGRYIRVLDYTVGGKSVESVSLLALDDAGKTFSLELPLTPKPQ